MYKPKFRITKALLENLNQIERLYGQLEVTPIPRQLLINLEKENMIDSSMTSSESVGNIHVRNYVHNMLIDNKIPSNRSEKEIANYYSILKNLPQLSKVNFDTKLIRSIHYTLMDGVNNKIKGRYRRGNIVIGKFDENLEMQVRYTPTTTKKRSITKQMNELVKWVQNSEDLPILKTAIYQHRFVHIHPFADGNGRVCRLTTALLLIKYGYQINRYFVLDDYYDLDRELYSDKLSTADKGDVTQWLEYFTEGVKYSLQIAHQKISTGLEQAKIEFRPSKREIDVLEILKVRREVTSSDLASDLEVSRQQAYNLLKSLVEKGYLEKIGSTKASYYKLV